MAKNQSKSKCVIYQKYFFQHLMVLCDFTAIWVLNTQGKRNYKGKGV